MQNALPFQLPTTTIISTQKMKTSVCKISGTELRRWRLLCQFTIGNRQYAIGKHKQNTRIMELHDNGEPRQWLKTLSAVGENDTIIPIPYPTPILASRLPFSSTHPAALQSFYLPVVCLCR